MTEDFGVLRSNGRGHRILGRRCERLRELGRRLWTRVASFVRTWGLGLRVWGSAEAPLLSGREREQRKCGAKRMQGRWQALDVNGHTFTRKRIRRNVHTHTYIYIYKHVCVYKRVQIYIYIYIHMDMYAQPRPSFASS